MADAKKEATFFSVTVSDRAERRCAVTVKYWRCYHCRFVVTPQGHCYHNCGATRCPGDDFVGGWLIGSHVGLLLGGMIGSGVAWVVEVTWRQRRLERLSIEQKIRLKKRRGQLSRPQ
jgi:hypothetical protein